MPQHPEDTHEIQVSRGGIWEESHGCTLQQIADIVKLTLPIYERNGWFPLGSVENGDCLESKTS